MSPKSFQKKLFGGAALILAGALAAGAALAQPAPGGPGRFARGIRAAMAMLDLTADQQTKVKAIFASHRDEAQAFRSQVKADRDALKAAASAADPDPAVVGAAFLKVRADREAAKAKMQAVQGRDRRGPHAGTESEARGLDRRPPPAAPRDARRPRRPASGELTRDEREREREREEKRREDFLRRLREAGAGPIRPGATRGAPLTHPSKKSESSSSFSLPLSLVPLSPPTASPTA